MSLLLRTLHRHGCRCHRIGTAFDLLLRRSVFSKTGRWDAVFTAELRQQVESHWRREIEHHHETRQATPQDHEASKYYILSMFPYPSGALHMGHVRVYTISDTMARYHRAAGRRVIHPMGWDAFGLPAENAAIERGQRPSTWTYSNIANMKEQLKKLSFSFDWDREYATCDPEYYRWTQHIFLQMYHAGLVYRKEAPVNWDPVDQTVLADEQIDDMGKSWRSGALVEKRLLRQWYIKTTAFSKSLIDGLQDVNKDHWRDIISLQHHWIGMYNGARFEFPLKNAADSAPMSVFTHTPEALFGTSHILLSPLHSMNKPDNYRNETTTDGEQKEIELNVKAVHPLTGQSLPIFVSWSHDFGEHLDSHIGIPSCIEEDRQFARRHSLPYEDVLDEENIINSGQFSGMTREEAFKAITAHAKTLRCGGDITSDRARDWLISRQRYWGTPIPIIHCDKYGTMAVPYDDLPVRLPEVTEFMGKGESPLAGATDWLRVKCPKCDGGADCYARRETDTMDTFVDSSWYYLRYLDARNEHAPFDPQRVERDLPVDLYIGGKEHAIMHLYYARFFNHFLHDRGMVPSKEPFINLLTQGMVTGLSYRLRDGGRYLPRDQVDCSGKKPVEKGTGAALITEWKKMSKSKYNGVDPQDVIDEFGSDATRLCILSSVSPKLNRKWSNDFFRGVTRWQNRLWSLIGGFLHARNRGDQAPCELSAQEVQKYDAELFDCRNYFLKEVTFHVEKSFLFGVAISRLQEMSTTLKKMPLEVIRCSAEYERALADLVIMLTPFAPLFASELWSGLASAVHKTTAFQWDGCVLDQKWPKVDEAYRLPLKVMINGRDAFSIPLPMSFSESHKLTRDEAVALTVSHPEYADNFSHLPLEGATLLIQPGKMAELELFVTDSDSKKKKVLGRVKRSKDRRTGVVKS